MLLKISACLNMTSRSKGQNSGIRPSPILRLGMFPPVFVGSAEDGLDPGHGE